MSHLGKSSGTVGPPVRLGDIAKARMGKTILSKELTEAGVPVFSAGRENEPWGYIPTSDLLFGDETIVIAARGNIGFPRVPRVTPFVSTQTTIAISLKDSRHVPYLRYQLETVNWPGMTSQTTIPMVTVRQVEGIEVSLPPVPEQRRIVAGIEKQFTRLEVGVTALRRVQANLKRYRAAVLKAACEGRLVPTDAGWKQTILGEVLIGIEAGRSYRCQEHPPQSGEIGVVKVSAVTWGTYDELESKTCLDASRMEERFFVRPDDFLFSRANTIELIGACVIAKKITLRVMLSDKILRFRFSSAANPSWILYWLRSRFGRSEIERLATGNQNSMRNIGQERIRQIIIKLPSIAEQMRIVAEVERRLSVVGELESVATANLQRATRLRQSILQKAFTGKLTASD